MILRDRIVPILSDVRFWIGAFFLLHLTSITLPPLEPGSTWRQTDGYMIARNFYETDSNILYPRVDIFGNSSGIVGCEFPILNYLVYLLSIVFGYHSWFGRLINLLASSTGVYFLYLLIRDHFGKQHAFNTAIVVLSSIWFVYNRTNIPDTFAASLCIISLYCGVRYLQDQRPLNLGVFLVAGMIGCLSRISAAVVLTPLVIPFLFGKTTNRARIMSSIVALIILGATCVWYFVWVPYLGTNFGAGKSHFFMGETFAEGFEILASDIPLVLKRFYETPMKYIAFVVFVASLAYAIKTRNRVVIAVFLIPFLAYSIIIVKIAIGLKVDAYYTILYMLPMAFVAGWGLSQMPKKLFMIILLACILIEGVANQIHVFKIRRPYKSLEGLEAVMDSVSRRNDLIAISGLSHGDPTPMYMAHRRGWSVPNETLAQLNYQKDFKSQGCVYIVIAKKVFGDIDVGLPKVYDSEFFTVYKL